MQNKHTNFPNKHRLRKGVHPLWNPPKARNITKSNEGVDQDTRSNIKVIMKKTTTIPITITTSFNYRLFWPPHSSFGRQQTAHSKNSLVDIWGVGYPLRWWNTPRPLWAETSLRRHYICSRPTQNTLLVLNGADNAHMPKLPIWKCSRKKRHHTHNQSPRQGWGWRNNGQGTLCTVQTV